MYWLDLDGERLALFRYHAPTVRLPPSLTPRERAIARDLIQGLSNAEIAMRAGRSIRTVANQVAALLRKTHSPSRAAFVAYVTRSSEPSDS